jgi:hypothetical protein
VRLTGVAGDDDWDMEFIRRDITSSLCTALNPGKLTVSNTSKLKGQLSLHLGGY